MNEPTEEQKKRLWEWCGFARYERQDPHWKDMRWVLVYPDKSWSFDEENWLPIDLNNLFKWAVPKLDYAEISYDSAEGIPQTYFATVVLEGKGYTAGDTTDPALALFWAIYKVMEEK